MEKIMHYVWQFALWGGPSLTTTDGRRITVLDRGQYNNAAGPDFFNAKISLDNRTWAGNVEMHVNASDWHRHHHDKDPAYDNVILHIVQHDDDTITGADGQPIPQVVMRCSPTFVDSYNAFLNAPAGALACSAGLPHIPPIIITDWVTSLGIRRLQRRADAILDMVDKFDGDWARAIFVTLARGLGFGTNAQPMEQLAMSIPIKLLLKHRDNNITTPALLFGRAGFLDDRDNDPLRRDPYYTALAKEYTFRCHAHELKPITRPQWKATTRPANSPIRRVALLAEMMTRGFDQQSLILSIQTIDQARALFAVDIPEYWRTHHDFGHQSARITEFLGKTSIDLLIINVVAPILYAHADQTDNDRMRDTAIALLHAIRPEQNSIITTFNNAGIPTRDAFDTQAIIELRREYCDKRKCLFCRLGHRLLSRAATLPPRH